jgi:4-hydroxybenzoate polyprenyltransferase
VPPLLRALRPSQWAKNLFVLAPLVFSHRLSDPRALERALLAFAAFCAAASAIYLVNDLRDREEDRNHPRKRHRPIASGALSPAVAAIAAAVLAGAAAALVWPLGRSATGFLAAYVALNLAYSMGMKHVVILDVMAIAMGFVLRVLGGAAAIPVPVSKWLLLCTTFVALFLAFSKRRHELTLLDTAAVNHRRVLESYSPAFLDQMINVVTASAVVSYALYATAPETVEKFHSDRLVYTLPLVLFGVFRYLYLTYQTPGEKNPTEAILRDAPFLINVALWGVAVVWIIYAA